MNLEKLYETLGKGPHRGIVCPLSYLKTEDSPQIGEFPDLVKLASFAKKTGFNIIQLLPIFDTGPSSSPYSSRSCYALNPIYLSLKLLSIIDKQDPDFIRLSMKSEELYFDYDTIYELKMGLLYRYINGHKESIQEDPGFTQFQKTHPWLRAYAAFCAHKEDTDTLPEYWAIDAETIAQKKPEVVFFHEVCQYFCYLQLKEAKEKVNELGIHLMGDIPILLSPDSVELWTHLDLFDPILTVGAPPDPLAPEGQAWGFPMLRFMAKPQASAAFWRDRIDYLSTYFKLYRIDHAVGFFRFWVIPRGKKSSQGFFFPASDELAVNNAKTLFELIFKTSPMIPIAEDLGTIPPYVPALFETMKLCGTKVLRWQRDWDHGASFIPMDLYPYYSMATVSTHDTSFLFDNWKEDLGAAKLLAEGLGFPFQNEYTPMMQEHILKKIHHASSLFVINLIQEYLYLHPDCQNKLPRFNVPGTFDYHNWTARMPLEIELLEKDSLFMNRLNALNSP